VFRRGWRAWGQHTMRDLITEFRLVILAATSHAPEVIKPGAMQRFATSDKRADLAGWCKLFDDRRGGVFGCHRQGISETWSATNRAEMTREERIALAMQVAAATAERQVQQQQQWAHNAQRITSTWALCVPLVPGDAVTRYLKRRGLGGVWPLPGALRFHRALPYWEGDQKLGTFPAMVAPIVAPNGRTVALHRTYLTADGRKADVPSPRKLTGAAGSLVGACIPLHKASLGCIGIAEGIETALAASCASAVPTVASYCAGNLSTWQWPAGLRRVVIFADADRAGREAAAVLQARALAAHLQCQVLTPTEAGADWADVWAQRADMNDGVTA
jgi:putative DNA primase/helicase